MKHLLLTLLLVLAYSVALAQTGQVRGQITSGQQPLGFAAVVLKNTSLGTTSGSDGLFAIKNIPVGTYDLVVSMVGYQTETRQVVVKDSSEVEVNLLLKEIIAALDEVVVTGVSRDTELRKSPVPIAFITKRDMHLNANSNVVDAVLKGVPGLSAVTSGPNISKPFIRGLGYNRVLTMYNGMRQEGQQWGDEHGIEVDQYGIERAEVVKGPASLIYGSDAVAGVINFIPAIPKGPEGKMTGDAIAEYHSNNGLIGSSVGLAYRKGSCQSAFRVSGKTAQSYRNSVDGTVYGTAYRELNLSAMAGVEKAWGSSSLYATLYENLQEIPDGSRDSLSRKFTRQVLESDADDIQNRPLVPDEALRTYRINPLHQHIQHYRIFTRNRVKMGHSELNAMVGFQQSVRREYNHPTRPSQPGLYIILNSYNYDFKYNLPGWQGLETTLGVNGMLQTNRNSNGTDFPIPDYTLFDIGSFLFVKKSFGKSNISGGLRYDSRHLNWQDFYVRQNPATGFDQATFFPDIDNATLQFPSYNRQFTGFSGSLGLTYNLTERLLLKGNLARGYRAPNITEVGSNGLDPGARIVYMGNRNFNPEFSLQSDVGLMAYLKKMDISLELFNNSIQNYIYQARLFDAAGNPVVIVPGNFTYQYQQSEARLYGAEISLNLHLPRTKWLEFRNSLAYIRGINKNQALIRLYGDAARHLPFIPPLHGRSEIRVTRERATGRFSKTYLRAELDYYGAQNRVYAVDNSETPTAGYALVNAGAGTTLNNRNGQPVLQLVWQVDNVLDIAYQSHLNRLKYFEYYSASPTGRLGIFDMGRNISFKVIYDF